MKRWYQSTTQSGLKNRLVGYPHFLGNDAVPSGLRYNLKVGSATDMSTAELLEVMLSPANLYESLVGIGALDGTSNPAVRCRPPMRHLVLDVGALVWMLLAL